MRKTDTGKTEWLEITERIEEFQKIIRLLVEFDERTGRHQRYSDPEGHYLRKAASTASPTDLRVFVRDLGGSAFYVVVRINAASGHGVCGYIHEDGIAIERQTLAPDHPVHSIVCLSDLTASAKQLDLESVEKCVRNLMEASDAA